MKVSPVGHNSPLFCHIFGLNNALKALADPPHFSPEIGATETSKKSPEAAETMASLFRRRLELSLNFFHIVMKILNILWPSVKKYAAVGLK